jgi:DNA-directed RNA polymerase specialized sigma subunit
MSLTTKDYLSQALRVDCMINAKLEQIQQLRELSTKATSTLSDMPKGGNQSANKTQDIVLKIIGLENEISKDMITLIDLKGEIINAIKSVKDPEYRLLLELRYLCFKSWSDVAAEMRYDTNSIFRMHRYALKSVKI